MKTSKASWYVWKRRMTDCAPSATPSVDSRLRQNNELRSDKQMSDCDSHPYVLLVEGSDDKHVIIQLSKRKELPCNFCIIETGSKEKLLERD